MGGHCQLVFVPGQLENLYFFHGNHKLPVGRRLGAGGIIIMKKLFECITDWFPLAGSLTYKERLHRKAVSFSGARCMKGQKFH